MHTYQKWNHIFLHMCNHTSFCTLEYIIATTTYWYELHFQLRNIQTFKCVATLVLGLRPRQRELQGCRPRGSPGVTSHTPGSARKCEGVWRSEHSHSKATPTLGDGLPVDSRNFRERLQGSNLHGSCVLYIIGKLLERRCLKWARLAHLDIWNTSYGQKKGQESNCQFDSRPQKVGNRPLPDVRFGSATRRWKALDESYNFSSGRIAIQGLLAKLWGSKVPGVPFGAILRLPLGSPGKNSHLDVGSVESHRVYYKGGRWWLPPSPGRGESCVSVLPVDRPSTKGAPTLH